MPSPGAEPCFINTAFDVGGERLFGPLEHRLVIDENPAQEADGGSIGDGIGVIDMMAISRLQTSTSHLVNSDQQFSCIAGTKEFIDESIDFGIAKGVDVRDSLLLFMQPFTQSTGCIRVIKKVASGLELDLEFRDGKRPCAERLHQAALEIKEAEQAP